MGRKRHDPFERLIAIQDQPNRLFADGLENQEMAPGWWSSPVDIYEVEDQFPADEGKAEILDGVLTVRLPKHGADRKRKIRID